MSNFDVDDPSPTPFLANFTEENVTRIQVNVAEMAVGGIFTVPRPNLATAVDSPLLQEQ